jgi:hypothetical protein
MEKEKKKGHHEHVEAPFSTYLVPLKKLDKTILTTP